MLAACSSLATPPQRPPLDDDAEEPHDKPEGEPSAALTGTLTGDASPDEVVVYILSQMKSVEDLEPLLTMAREHPKFKGWESDKYLSEGLTKDDWEFGTAISDPEADLEEFCMFCVGPIMQSKPKADPDPAVAQANDDDDVTPVGNESSEKNPSSLSLTSWRTHMLRSSPTRMRSKRTCNMLNKMVVINQLH